MDLRRVDLDFAHAAVRALCADAGGERSIELAAERAAGVLAEASELVALLDPAGRGLASVAIDFVTATLQIEGANRREQTFAGPAGAPFEAALLRVARAVLADVRRPRIDDPGIPLDANFWSGLYQSGHDGWELARPAPPLERWVKAHDIAGQRALVVGCGRGHEARLLARAGARVVAVDVAPEALADARALAVAEGLSIDFRLADLFMLADAPAERYELLLEHCCFCAIRPEQRLAYARVAAAVLVPGGHLWGLFWSHGRPGGPPFSVQKTELETLFVPPFTVRAFEIPSDSVASRRGQELLLDLQR